MSSMDAVREELHGLVRNSPLSIGRTAEQIGCSERHLQRMLADSSMSPYWAERIAALCGYRIVISLEKVDQAP